MKTKISATKCKNGNILLLEIFVSLDKASGANIANFVGFFTNWTKLAIMPILRLYYVKIKKIQWQNVTPSEDRTLASHEPLIPSPTLFFLS